MEPINILVLDTSSLSLKLALSINNKTSYVRLTEEFKHIENLLPQIERAFSQINEPKSALDYLAVACGPGSFTGIRIGIASSLGIAYASKITCFGFSAFDVYRYLYFRDEDVVIVPIIDAKKNRFYCSFIDSDEKTAMHDLGKEDILAEIQKNFSDKKVVFCGSDFQLIKDFMIDKIDYQWMGQHDYSPEELLEFCTFMVKSKASLSSPHPIYLRKSEAEIAYLKQKQK